MAGRSEDIWLIGVRSRVADRSEWYVANRSEGYAAYRGEGYIADRSEGYMLIGVRGRSEGLDPNGI